MKKIAGIETDKDLAKILEISPSALSNFKKKDDFPTDLAIKFALAYNESIDYVLFDRLTINESKDLLHCVSSEFRPSLEAFLEVMSSNHEGVISALSQNVAMFQETVRSVKRIAQLERDMEAIKKVLNQNDPPGELKEG